MWYIKIGDKMKQKNINIDEFLIALDNLIASKYILAERKISDVLLQVARSADVYNLIAQCMINFDFKAEWKVATSAHFFKLPDTDEQRVAFIFCLLSNIDDKNIDFTNFLSQYFSAANSYSAYELFSKTVLIEFKRLVYKLLNFEDEFNGSDEQFNNLQDRCDNFMLLTGLINGFISKVKSAEKLKHSYIAKNELIAILSTFELVAKNKHTEYLYAFRVTLNSALAKNKTYKSEIEQINQLVDKIIRGIYE